MTGDWYRRGDTRDVVRRRGGVDLERVRTSCFPRSHTFVERLAPAVAAHGLGMGAAHRLPGGKRREQTEQERRRDDARGPHNTYGAGGGGWFEERFALRRTDCGCQLSVPAARISRAAALCRFARA